jgi:hypothetical protein
MSPDFVAQHRRSFMQHSGLAALGLFTAPTLLSSSAVAQTASLDVAILNFALNLEYLEAEFYLHGAFGRGLFPNEITGTGTPGGVSGGRAVNFQTPVFQQYAQEIANDEENHVNLIRKTLPALGSQPVARPQIDIGGSFTALARAAGVVGPTEEFDPYASESNFLIGAFIFEDVGVTAYKGAARLIQNKDVLEAAAGLLAVEAYHAGEIRTLMFQLGLADVAQKISDLRDAVDGSSDDDQGILLNGQANIVPTDANGLAFSRTPQQVLNIVYANPNKQPGGFFPAGVNGAIR